MRRRLPNRLVCSTLIERAWEAAGISVFWHTPDPGDFMRLCQRVSPLQIDNNNTE